MRIQVPATTTNFGPGFDTFGLALNLYNTFEFIQKDAFGVEVKGRSEGIARDENNLVIRVYRRCCEVYGERERPFLIRQEVLIPPARGLGSSATAIVAGIEAFSRLHRRRMSLSEKLRIAFEFEPHPDNLIPAFVGGFVICLGKTHEHLKVDFPEDLRILFVIPEYEVSTDQARKMLPEKVSLEEAVFNIQRASLLIGSILKKDYIMIGNALEDKLHQPYRKKLIRGYEELKDSALESGAIGVYISGSGPTIGVLVTEEVKERVRNSLEVVAKKIGEGTQVLELRATGEGVREG